MEQPGTYNADPRPNGCYFLGGGVYDFQAGITEVGGFVSNELRPPDEPNMVAAGQPNITALSADLTGSNQTQISVNPLAGAVPQNSQVAVEGQTFTVSQNAAAGSTLIHITTAALCCPCGRCLNSGI